MSIESSSTTGGPKATAVAESSGAKGKGSVKSGDAADGLAGTGFLALMTSIDSGVDASVEVADPGTDRAVQTLMPENPPVVIDAADSSAESWSGDLALLLAQAGAAAGTTGSKAGIAKERVLTALATSGRALSPATLLNQAAADPSQAVDVMLDQAQTLSALSAKGKSIGVQSAVAATVADARALQQAVRVDLIASEPALSGVLASSDIGDAMLKPAQRSGTKFSVLPGGGLEGAWGHQALLAGSRVNAPVVQAGAATPSFESTVADTVSYWVTQGVQNAELKLDGFGGDPVEVKISLKGDQAHIGFRTDQPEIRQMLEGALAHLKEALKSEGLVLSGVSVGASGQNGAGPQDQRNRPDSHQTGQASLLTTGQVPMPGQSRISLAAGRALDLFV